MTVLSSTLNAASRGCLTSIQGQVYFVNNFDACQVWDGITATSLAAGITGPAAVIGAPTSTAAGTTTIGVHGIRYRYMNSKTGYVSNPTPAGSVTVAGGAQSLTYNIAAAATPILTTTDTKCDTIVLEATPVNSGNYYQVGTAPNAAGSIVFNVADASLIQLINSDANYGSSQDLSVYTHEVPPFGTIMLSHKANGWILGDAPYALTGVTFTNGSATVTGTGFCTSGAWVGRVMRKAGDTFATIIASVTNSTTLLLTVVYPGSTSTTTATVYSSTPNRGYYSRPGAPEEYYKSVYARDFLQNRSDQVVAAISRKEAMYIFGLFSSQRLIYDSDPSAATSTLSLIQGNRGVFNQRCLVDVEGRLYAFDRQGIYLVNEVPQHISFPIDDALSELVDYSQSVQFHGSYDPKDRIALFWFVKIGDTVPKYAACLEIDTGRWFFDSWFQGITASGVVPTSDGQVRCMLGDENGYSWFFGVDGSFDGVPPTSASVVTVASAASALSVTVNETLPAVSPTLAGVVCYNPLTDLYAIITSNTASTLTLAAGLVSTPTVGQDLYLGPIAFEYRSKWWMGEGQQYKKKPVYLNVKLFPGSATGKLRIYVYADFQTTPTTATKFVTDTDPDGTTITNGNGYIDVTLNGGTSADGFVSVPMNADWRRALQARVTCLRPDGALRILNLDFDLEGKQQVEVTGG